MTINSSGQLPESVLQEARELARAAEILPGGVDGLAGKIHEVRNDGRVLRVKLGVDPTSCDLHLGHAVVLRKLRRFQEFGHKAVLIVGGFTAQIGDPTGRNSTRPALTAGEVADNARTFLDQVGLLLDMENLEVRNNSDWLCSMDLSQVLKLAGSVTLSQLLAKESFGSRVEKGQPVGLHEVFYPLLQAFDSVTVDADVEIGGTDQRFNMLTGRQLQEHFGKSPQVAMLLPLLEGTDGRRKMSKTFDNSIGLTDAPDDMVGKCMRLPDELILRWFELATVLTGAEIDAVAAELESGNPKDVKERLAHQLVRQFHSAEEADRARDGWRRVHSQRQIPDEMASHVVSSPAGLVKLLVDAGFAPSNNQARKLISGGGVRLDGIKVEDVARTVDVPGADGVVLQVGRRKFVRLMPSG